MPQIPVFNFQPAQTPQAAAFSTSEQFGAGVGRGTQQFGQGISDHGQGIYQFAERKREAVEMGKHSEANLSMQDAWNKFSSKENLAQIPEEKWQAEWQRVAASTRDQIMKGIDPHLAKTLKPKSRVAGARQIVVGVRKADELCFPPELL